jgi:DNA repair exonuclease SbcCD ATPase subunit
MTFEKIPSKQSVFTHIIHVADIHIRLTKRHAEYREVFRKFYDDVKNSPESSIICVVGDVCHSKSDLSPECVQMVSEFLFTLAELRETILTPGNHDATLSNKTRLDSLSPIVEALAHPRLHYLTESKLYGIGNILFNNMCIFDDPKKYIRGNDIPDLYRNEYKHIVALFHGPMDRCVTDTGFAISNPAIMPELFDWHHIALLGDIHRRQNMQEMRPEDHKPCIHYCGSMLQQNHGEPLHPHGYTLWDLDTYDYHYKELPNDYGFFTVDVVGPKILTDLSDIPKKTYLRIKCTDAIATEVKGAEALISTLTEVVETARLRVESETDKKAKEALVCKDVKISEISDEDYQAKLISEFLTAKLNLTDQEKLDKILLINRIVNTEIQKDDFSRNLKWKPIRFEWDNMFAYGEDNVIDFTQMSGNVYGVFGPNTCGKSSIFSALSFCLFDKWERGFKAIVVRNSSKEGFRCKFEFEISGIRYFIEKIGETTRTGNVRVEVNFWRVVNGANEDLTDVQRRKTNDVIREYLGTFEDFILTTYSIQNTTKNNINFIDMGNTERKDLLVQILGLHVFDRLYERAYERGKELTVKLKPHRERNYIQELDLAEKNLAIAEGQIQDCQNAIDDYTRQIRDVNDSIVAETARLIKLDADVPTDLPALESRRLTTTQSLEKITAQITADKSELVIRRQTMDRLSEEISEIIAEDLVKAHRTYNEFRGQLEVEKRKLELKRVDIKNKNEKLDKLKVHKYDPNCKFCVENIFVKDARQTEKDLQKDQSEMDALVQSIKTLETRLEEWGWVDVAYQNYTKLLNDHSKAKDVHSSLNTKVLLAEKDAEKLTQASKEIERKIGLYHKNEVSVENNQKVNMTILTYKNALNKLESNLNAQNKSLLLSSGNRQILQKQIGDINATIMDLIATEEERELYDYYCKAVGRNGIPYQVICNTIPEITREINSILTQTTEFIIEIESDDKNIVPYVNYEVKGRWPIEMASGFERFMASIAIRVALSNITNLPRTNFLIIDEGFGTLDPHHLTSMHTLFTYLKSHFDFLMVISHLDALKDMVDKQIEVAQIGNLSKVVLE